MNIETKANVGDTVFYLKRINRVPCPVCAGTGKIHLGTAIKPNAESPATFAESIGEQFMQNLTEMMTGNVRAYNCPECGGKGTVKATGQAKYEVGEGVVISVEATMSQDKEKVIYRVTDSGNYTNRTVADDKLYLDQASAEKECAFMNLERRLVRIEYVEVPCSFAATIPCNEKLMLRLDEWRNHRKFETEIFVDENLKLFDGYTSYLVYRMFGVSEIPVVIWPNNKGGNE